MRIDDLFYLPCQQVTAVDALTRAAEKGPLDAQLVEAIRTQVVSVLS